MNFSVKEFQAFIKQKEIVLFTVTKDTVNFLKLYDLYKPDFKIKAIVDPSLDYRLNVKKIIDEMRGNIPLFTSLVKAESVLKNAFVLKFDIALTDEVLMNEVEEFDSSKINITEFERKIKKRYEKYTQIQKGSEFTFCIPARHLCFINSWLFHCCNATLMHCYGDMLLISVDCHFEQPTEEEIAEKDKRVILINHNAREELDADDKINLYHIGKKIRKIKPVFVISSDYGIGKMTYLLDKMKNFLTCDTFMLFFDESCYYGSGSLQNNTKNTINYIHDKLYDLKNRNRTEGEVYIKIEGCLTNWLYNIEHGRTMQWDYYHLFFDDYEFHVILKEDEDMTRFSRDIKAFCSIHAVDPDKVKIVCEKNHAEYFEPYLLKLI